jgi:hypothetical protein
MRRPLKIAALLGALFALGAVAYSQAETIQKAGIRVALNGSISPNRLPRQGVAPVAVKVETKISSKAKKPAQLQRIQIAINSHGRIDPTGLPKCEVSDIQPSTTEKAMEACKGSLVGEGSFDATVALSKASTFPSQGKMFAFNGTYKGRPAILAHVYGTKPVPTSFTLPFVIGHSKGTFATTLTATIPPAEGNYVSGISLTLSRTFTYKGKQRSYASAGCPAPKGTSKVAFPFAQVDYAFVGGKRLSSALTRSCRAG